MRRIEINPKYSYLQTFIESVPERMLHEGKLLKDGRNMIKVLQTPDGQQLNVKRYHIPAVPNRLIYSLGLRKPKGQRAYEYPEILLQKGISTPENIAYIEERQGGLLGYSYFICTQCDYEHELYEVGHAPSGTYDELAVALATFTAHMHDAGVMHRDYSPGNILWCKDAEGYHFSIIDINRMYFGPVDMQHGCANFARLWGPKQFIEVLAKAYAQQRGFDEEQAVKITMKYRARFWKRFLKKHTVSFEVEL
jgi:serine/threonine protein kinase